MFLSSPYALSDELDERINEAIRTACLGNLVNKDSGPISKYVYENSPFCREVKEQGDNANIDVLRRKHHFPLTQEDLVRIYDPSYVKPARFSEIELECIVHTPGEPSGVDFMCNKTRSRLAAANIPMSQAEYDQVSEYCSNEPTWYGCIEQWVDEEWIKKGTRRVPVRGLSLDDQLAKAKTSPAPSPLKMPTAQNLDTVGQRQSQTTVSLKLDNILETRERIRIDGIKDDLVAISDTIAGRCSCAADEGSCFNGYEFDYPQLEDILAQADANFEGQHYKLCAAWSAGVTNTLPDAEITLNQYIRDGNAVLATLDDLDTRFNDLNTALRNKETEIMWAQKEAEEQQGGFNLGKFAGLATGTLIGASMGGLGETETLNMLAGAALDSMDGVDGTSNLEASIAGMTEAHVDYGTVIDGMQGQAQHTNNDAGSISASNTISADTFSVSANTGSEQTVATAGTLASVDQDKTRSDAAIGAYIRSHAWKTCVVLEPGGAAYYKVQTLENWNNPHSAYTWNQEALSGTWTMSGDKVTIEVSGEHVNPSTGASESKSYKFGSTLVANKLGDATRVGHGLGACR